MVEDITSEFTTIMARDGHEFQAWLAPPPGRPSGAIVVVQEIFGVNSHIRAVTDGYAKEGYVAIAPCLFDRVRRGIELGYSRRSMQEGRGYVTQLKQEQTLSRHRRRHCGGRQRRSSRRRRLLLGRHDRLCSRLRSADRLRGRLLRRQHHAAAREAAEVSGHVSLRRKGQAHYAERHRQDQAAIQRASFICTPRIMASTAISAAATMRRAPRLHVSARSPSLPNMLRTPRLEWRLT